MRRPDARSVDQRAKRDVDVDAVPHDGVQERAADAAARVVRVVVAPDEQRVRAFEHLELVPLDARERLERRTGRSAAIRAMAVHRVSELVATRYRTAAHSHFPFSNDSPGQ